jgi:hypothetical protein
VSLSGGDSFGPVVSYSWLHDAGTLIALSNPIIANPTFMAPNLTNGLLDITFTLIVFDSSGNSSLDTTVVHVSDPVTPAPDVITIVLARFTSNKQKWRVDGSAAVLQNQTVTIYVGNSTGPFLYRQIGEAIVDAIGAWNFRPGNGSAAPETIPVAGDTHVWAISSLGGTPGSLEFRAK